MFYFDFSVPPNVFSPAMQQTHDLINSIFLVVVRTLLTAAVEEAVGISLLLFAELSQVQ